MWLEIDASFQGVKTLPFFAFYNTNSGNNNIEITCHQEGFLPRVDITKYNVLNDSRNFYDQSVKDPKRVRIKMKMVSRIN